ncbi:penicillin-binding protein 2 [Oligoflexaceae bacterium]|nr:penicillin-binding protein 2 [Oligoflexaceae bacterium]
MKKQIKQIRILVESRFTYATIFVLALTLILLSRLWHIQIYQGDRYEYLSERNRVRKLEIPAPRGGIFDRYKKPILTNKPFYDLALVPQYAEDLEQTFKAVSLLLHVPITQIKKRYRMGRGVERYLPIVIKKNLSIHEVSVIESNRIFLPGIEVLTTPRRNFADLAPPHLIGYLSEIDQKSLQSLNENLDSKEAAYRPGDLIGKHGLEKKYEHDLRGRPGYRFLQVDAFGRKLEENKAYELELPLKNATPGHDLELTIDMELQLHVDSAFKGKYGAVVVMNPKNGEILALNSSPGYSLKKFQRGLSKEEWNTLLKHPYNPLYDKTTAGEYPPGSLYKAVVAAAALEEKVVKPDTEFHCPGYYTLGNETFKCWKHSGHGWVNLRKAMMQSCDTYFYEIGVELGADKIAKYARLFGMGEPLGLDVNSEKSGLIPTTMWKKLTHRIPWTAGDTPNVAIGQGYNLMTPLQMASLYASFGNGGKVWRPYVVQRVVDHVGRVQLTTSPELLKQITEIKPSTFRIIRKALQAVVMDEKGTGKNGAVEGQSVAGKTGSVQVVSLKKNRNRSDVSFKWKEHAMFAAFSPVDDPEIAISVVSENDLAGGGGSSAAAPIAGKILKAYWDLKEQRKNKKIAKNPKESDVH